MGIERERLLKARSCTNMRMRQATRALSDYYDAVMEPTGLHANQFMLLIPPYLHDGLTISQLAEIEALDRTTLARNLKLLEQRELIVLRPGQDQRTRVIEITERGRQILEAAFPLWEQAQQQVNALIGSNDLAHLYSTLSTLDKLRVNAEIKPSLNHSD